MVQAGSASSGLSQDTIKSLGKLAERLDKPGKRLEDILNNLDPKDRGELDKLHRIQNAIERGPYLD